VLIIKCFITIRFIYNWIVTFCNANLASFFKDEYKARLFTLHNKGKNSSYHDKNQESPTMLAVRDA